MSMSDELKKRLEENSPYRVVYYEQQLNRIASEVGGNAKFQAERITGIMTEIDGVRQELSEVRGLHDSLKKRIDRMADFLNTLKKNGDKPEQKSK